MIKLPLDTEPRYAVHAYVANQFKGLTAVKVVSLGGKRWNEKFAIFFQLPGKSGWIPSCIYTHNALYKGVWNDVGNPETPRYRGMGKIINYLKDDECSPYAYLEESINYEQIALDAEIQGI